MNTDSIVYIIKGNKAIISAILSTVIDESNKNEIVALASQALCLLEDTEEK